MKLTFCSESVVQFTEQHNSVPVQCIVIKSQELAVSEVVAIMAATSSLVVKLVSYIIAIIQYI